MTYTRPYRKPGIHYDSLTSILSEYLASDTRIDRPIGRINDPGACGEESKAKKEE